MIIAFLIGIILASSIAVYATINASSIDYTKEGSETTTKVDTALDDLYSRVNNYKYTESQYLAYGNTKYTEGRTVGCVKRDDVRVSASEIGGYVLCDFRPTQLLVDVQRGSGSNYNQFIVFSETSCNTLWCWQVGKTSYDNALGWFNISDNGVSFKSGEWRTDVGDYRLWIYAMP